MTRYYADPEKDKANAKTWRDSNPEKVKANREAWRKDNSEKEKKTKKSWYEANSEKVKDDQKFYREANHEKVSAKTKNWRRANPENVRASARKRRARKNGAKSDLTLAQDRAIKEAQNHMCFFCGRFDERLTQEHIVPLTPRGGGQQGDHTAGNIVYSCQPCNSSKNNEDPLVWYFRVRWQGSEIWPVAHFKNEAR